jgi:hypothetical protein
MLLVVSIVVSDEVRPILIQCTHSGREPLLGSSLLGFSRHLLRSARLPLVVCEQSPPSLSPLGTVALVVEYVERVHQAGCNRLSEHVTLDTFPFALEEETKEDDDDEITLAWSGDM